MRGRDPWTIFGIALAIFFCGFGTVIFLGIGRGDPPLRIAFRNETGETVVVEEGRRTADLTEPWIPLIELRAKESATAARFYEHTREDTTSFLRARSRSSTVERSFRKGELEAIAARGGFRIRNRGGRLVMEPLDPRVSPGSAPSSEDDPRPTSRTIPRVGEP